jgi:acetyl-CoA carboxylase biotin carboxyl carrier protein
MNIDIRQIKKLIEVVEQSTINEIEIVNGEETIRVRRNVHEVAYQPQPVSTVYTAPMVQQPAAPVAPAAAPQAPAPKAETETGHKLLSPMVGTFYRSSGPDAKPFVEEGQSVKIGDPLCIVEAMKMMNQITSDKDGVIKKILVQNGEAVEFEQPLFIIE